MRGADDRLRGSLVGDVAIVNRLEHVGVILVGHHMNFRIDIEALDRTALVGNALMREARRETSALHDRRIIFPLGDVVHRQRFDPGASRRQIHPSHDRCARAGKQVGFRRGLRHLFVGQMRRTHALVEDQLVFFMFPDRPLNVERRLHRCRAPTIAPALDVMRIMQVPDLLPCWREFDGKYLLVLRSFEVPIEREQAKAKADETRSGLKELGLDDNVSPG